MKKRSRFLQVDPNINLLTKKIDTFAPRDVSQNWKNRFFSINVRILYGKKVRFGHGRKSKRVIKKRSWGLQVDLNINLLSKKIDTFAPRIFSQN